MLGSSFKIYLEFVRNISKREFRFTFYKGKYLYSSVVRETLYYAFQLSVIFHFIIISPPNPYSNVLKNIGVRIGEEGCFSFISFA